MHIDDGHVMDECQSEFMRHNFKLKNHIPKYELIEKYKSIQMLLIFRVKK